METSLSSHPTSMAQLGYSTQPLGNKLLPSRVTESLSTLLPCKSQNDRLLATVSDSTARLWNLDTNLPVGPPLQHKERVLCTALSDDGTVLVTGGDKDVYAWDIHAILKKAGLEDLLPPHVAAAKSPMNRNATRRPPIHARQIPPGFFDGVRGDIHSSTLHGVHSPSSYRVLAPSIGSARALFSRIPSFFRRSHSQFQQTPKQGIFSPLDPRTVEVAAVQDKKVLLSSYVAIHRASNPL
ncbi:hypothetical protein EDD22DRAFT_171412 [Suillus occidentalis]|nr:hypothetical protein EDD22DRAFT_171412 [Suillus occidentalis]